MIQRTLLTILMVLCPFGPAWADDWAQWRGPERTGVSKEKGLLDSWPPTGPKLLWIFRDAGVGFSSMSVVGDRLYCMGGKGDKDCFFAIDLKTQKKIWSVEVGDLYKDSWGELNGGPNSSPTVAGNFLYALGGYGDLVCVETATGRKVWSQSLKKDLRGVTPFYGYSESPLVDGNVVVITPGGKRGALAALDKKTGALKWRSTPSTNHSRCDWYSSIIAIEVGGVRQYVQAPYQGARRGLIGVRASDGKLLWESLHINSACCTPIYGHDCVYQVAPGSCYLLKLKLRGDQWQTEQIYTNEEMQNYNYGVVLVGEHLYGYSSKWGWLCQEFKTGKPIWKQSVKELPNGFHHPGRGKGSVVYADGNLYCYHENRGDVLLLEANPAGYKEKGSFRIPEGTKIPHKDGYLWTHPVVANGKLYLRDQDLIFCYDIRKPQ